MHLSPQSANNGRSFISLSDHLKMNTLTWDDLFVDAALLNFDTMLLEWPGLITERIRPIGASVFGDLFFQKKSGEVCKLDVLEGGVSIIADSFQQFSEFMNSREWQEQHLLSQGIALLKDKGIYRTSAQFFGFAPHPSLTGKIDWSRVMPLDAVVWNSICAQALGVAPAPVTTMVPSASVK